MYVFVSFGMSLIFCNLEYMFELTSEIWSLRESRFTGEYTNSNYMVNLRRVKQSKCTPLIHAARLGHINCVRVLLEAPGANIDATESLVR